MTTGKTIALTIWTFVGKEMPLHFKMLSWPQLFFQGTSIFNFMTAITICSDFGAQENKVCHCFHCFPIYLSWSGKQRHYFANKGPSSQGYGFFSSHVWMWELDRRKPKNWCFWTVVLEKTLKSPLDCKEIQPVHSEGDQSWLFTGRTKAKTPVLWLPDAKSWLIGKDPDAGRDWGQEEKETTEDEMAGWHHRLDGHEFE